jgi:hypothetical protein
MRALALVLLPALVFGCGDDAQSVLDAAQPNPPGSGGSEAPDIRDATADDGSPEEADAASHGDAASSNGDAANDDGGGGPVPVPADRGASVPWDEYEAEDASTNAVVLEASSELGTIQAESSGRRAVRLENVGDYVAVTTPRAINAIVVRYSIPDASAGGGLDATLGLYVGGVKHSSLALTSRHAWHYGVTNWQNAGPSQPSEDPNQGGAFHFYDETRALIGSVPAGTELMLRKDADDAAAHYVIDLIDLEQAPEPVAMPASYLSLTADCGATANDAGDDGLALQTCVTRAKNEAKAGVFIPAGTFELTTQQQSNMGIMVSDVAVQGAGMWHSVLHGAWAQFHCTGNACRFADFSILGETTGRNDGTPDNGFNGSAGTGSRLDRVWVEHKKVGFWVGLDAQSSVTDGLIIADSRFRNLFADGVNFCNGTRNSEVVNTHFRYTGDDALASWAYASTAEANQGNAFRFNTVQLPWRANCFAVYGGSDTRIEDNVCFDTLTFPGIQVGGPYPQHAFGGETRIERNTLVRAGGYSFNQKHGALKLFSYQVSLTGVVVSDLEVIAPTYFGIDVQSWGADSSLIDHAALSRITIHDAGEYGMQVRGDARGSVTLSGVAVEAPGLGGLSDLSPTGQLTIDRGAGNSGW